jgi:hypothetical protein
MNRSAEVMMNMSIFPLVPRTRWEVYASDAGQWRSGIYRPEFGSGDEVDVLERHSCPELFICAGGRMGMVTWDGVRETVIEFNSHDSLLVEDYHNGFRIDDAGFFIVVERTSFVTEYIDRRSKNFLRRVTV